MRRLVVRRFGKADLAQPLLLTGKDTKNSRELNELIMANKDQIP